MSNARTSPLESVLNLIAAAAPGPWYPQLYAEETDSDPDALGDVLEMAWLEKLVEKADSGPKTGPGFVLTELGERVRADPEVRQRLREGLPLLPNHPGAIVRSSLRLSYSPVVSKVILFANLLVFGYGISMSWHDSALLQSVLTGFPKPGVATDYIRILHKSGSVEAADLLAGQWWRLLTTCFVHAGLLHLGMNMYMLYQAGAFVEQTWGRARFLIIYVLAGWGGSCLAVAYTPEVPVVGASSALCGIFGAEAVWILLYGKYLPRHIARRGRSQIVVNLLLLTFISLLPRVSGYAHLGGGLAGAAAALVLHFQRFGAPAMRVAAVVLLLPIPWVSYAILNRARANSPKWQQVVENKERREQERKKREEREERERPQREKKERERRARKEIEQREKRDRQDFEKRFLNEDSPTAVGESTRAAERAYEERIIQLLNRHPTRRPAGEVEQAQTLLAEQRKKLQTVAAALEKAGPYEEEVAEAARQAGRAYAQAQAELFAQAQRCLRLGEKWGQKDEEALVRQQKKVAEMRKRWRECFE